MRSDRISTQRLFNPKWGSREFHFEDRLSKWMNERRKKCIVLRESVHKHRWNTVQICWGFSASFTLQLRSSNRHIIIKERWFKWMFIEKPRCRRVRGNWHGFVWCYEFLLFVAEVPPHPSIHWIHLYMCALDKRYEEYILRVYITREEDVLLMHPLKDDDVDLSCLPLCCKPYTVGK